MKSTLHLIRRKEEKESKRKREEKIKKRQKNERERQRERKSQDRERGERDRGIKAMTDFSDGRESADPIGNDGRRQ